MTDWFEELFGFSEFTGNTEKWKKTQSNFRVDGETLTSVVNNKKYSIGKFSTPSLKELRLEGTPLLNGAPTVLKFSVTEDVMEDHSNPDNNFAVFQVASQFNCLEFPVPSSLPEDGVSPYTYDPTQGPACAISAAPATVYRNYFALVNGEAGQEAHRQINTIRDLHNRCHEISGVDENVKFWEVRNGYTFATVEQLNNISELLDMLSYEDLDELREVVRVGIQYNVDVTSSSRTSVLEKITNKVSQVFCSALSVSYSGRPAKLWKPLGKLILQAAYEATLWAGVINYHKTGCNKVYLTCVGGGAFGNPVDWIADAIARAVHTIPNSGLEVHVLNYAEINQNLVRLCGQYRDKYQSISLLIADDSQNQHPNDSAEDE